MVHKKLHTLSNIDECIIGGTSFSNRSKFQGGVQASVTKGHNEVDDLKHVNKCRDDLCG